MMKGNGTQLNDVNDSSCVPLNQRSCCRSERSGTDYKQKWGSDFKVNAEQDDSVTLQWLRITVWI